MLNSELTSDERIDLFSKYLFFTDSMLEEIKETVRREERLYGCSFVMVDTKTYPQIFIFLRQDRFRDVLIFEKCYLEHYPAKFDPELTEFRYIYSRLYADPKFQSQVERIESEGLRFIEVQSSIVPPSFADRITAVFADGDDEVRYAVDEELNFTKIL